MTTAANIVRALKRQLRRQGITYRVLAERLGLSESAVKHMFSKGTLSLRRLDDICAIAELSVGELVDLADAGAARIEALPHELEHELVADLRLLLMAYCLVNYWTFDEVVQTYAISRSEGMLLLARLDRMKLIELQPGNRVRLLISNSFRWQPNGPIETFFRSQVQAQFFNSDFSGDGALRIVKNGMLSVKAQRQFIDRLRAIGEQFDDTTRDERRLTAAERQGTTMVLAIRNWGFEGFRRLERAAG